jgi:hypothetical protein
MAGQTNLAVSVLLNARDKLTGSLGHAKRATSKLGRAVEKVGHSRGFAKLRRSIARVGGAAKHLAGRLAKVTAGVTAAAAGAAAAVTHMVGQFAAGADETGKMAHQLGIGVESLQEWQFVAKRMGVDQSTLNQSLGAFTKRVGEARHGTGALTTQLKKSNPALLKQLQHTQSTGQAFKVYLKAIAHAKTATDKAALASAGFSRAGLKLIRMTRGGAEHIDKLRKKSHELGGILGEKVTKQAAVFENQLKDMETAIGGVRDTLMTQLMPTFIKVMKKITGWIVKNKNEIAKWAKGFAAKLPGRLKALKHGFFQVVDAAKSFLNTAKAVIKPILPIIDHFGRAKVALAAVAAVLTGPLLAALATAGAAVVSFGITLMATPIGWILAGIAGIATAVYEIYKHWDGITAWFGGLWDSIASTVRDAWHTVTDLFKAANPLKWIKPAFEATKDWLSNIDWSGIGKALIRSIVEGIKSAASSIGDAVSGALGSAKDAVTGGLSSAGHSITDAAHSALSKVRNMLPFSDAKTGPLSNLTASGRALPATLAKGIRQNQGALVGAVDRVMGAADKRLDNNAIPLRPSARRPSDRTASGGLPSSLSRALASGHGGRSTRVGRVDVNAPITIHMGETDRPEAVGEAVADQLSSLNLWGDLQGLPEAAG